MSKEEYILNWISEVSKVRPELSGFSVCPYARLALYEVIEVDIDKIEPVPGYDVIIYIVDDDLNPSEIEEWVQFYDKKYEKWSFFKDCATYDNFIGQIKTNNGKYNLILAQEKEKLRKIRKKMVKTGYYDLWDQKYLQEILKDDLDLIDNR
jgi:hypothetical protein